MDIKKIGGRKFTLVCLVFIMSVILILTKKLDNQAFYEIMKLIILGYPLGNISQSFLMSKFNITEVVSQDDPLGGRKYGLTIVIYISAALLYYFDYILKSSYVDLTYWIVTVYILGNVTGKLTENGVTVSINKR